MNYTPKLLWQNSATLSERLQPLSEGPRFIDNLEKFQNGEIISTTSTVDLRQWCSPIEDQGHVGSCGGNGAVGALELLQNRLYGSYTDLSRLFVYYNARLMTGDQAVDSGCYIHVAFETLKNIGTCTENSWPYDVNSVFMRPSWASYGEAYPNKVESYYRIGGKGSTRTDVIECAISSGYPVVFGMNVDQAYMDYTGGIVPMYSGKNKGGHCQVIVGYDATKRLFIVRNSWGTGWGEGGYALLPYDYLDAADAADFCVPTIAPKM